MSVDATECNICRPYYEPEQHLFYSGKMGDHTISHEGPTPLTAAVLVIFSWRVFGLSAHCLGSSMARRFRFRRSTLSLYTSGMIRILDAADALGKALNIRIDMYMKHRGALKM